MGNRDHNNVLGPRNIEDTVRETANQSTPQVAVDLAVQAGILLDRRKRYFERDTKLQTQSSFPLLVPFRGFGDIILGFWTKDEPVAPFARQMRSRTSAQGEPA